MLEPKTRTLRNFPPAVSSDPAGSIAPALAKKNRTPPPPRRVQAPKRRDDRSRTVGPGARPGLWLGVAAVAAAAVIAAIVAFVVLGGDDDGGGNGSQDSLAATMRAAGCTFNTYPDQGQNHVGTLTPEKPAKYNSSPPTSGTHYFQPAPWNFYTVPVDSQLRVIHNLEHGGIVVQWGTDVPDATVDQLRGFWQESPHAMLMAPLPTLGDKIAVTAWRHLSSCTAFDQGAFAAFRDEYRLKGPEAGFNEGNTQPGS